MCKTGTTTEAYMAIKQMDLSALTPSEIKKTMQRMIKSLDASFKIGLLDTPFYTNAVAWTELTLEAPVSTLEKWLAYRGFERGLVPTWWSVEQGDSKVELTIKPLKQGILEINITVGAGAQVST